jgi:acetyl-CoA carboxylase beta subunit
MPTSSSSTPDAATRPDASGASASTSAPSNASDTAASGTAASGNYWDFCPNCSSRLYNQGCKYRCPNCHYFMSCSDFD